MNSHIETRWEAAIRRSNNLNVSQLQLLATFCASLFMKAYMDFCIANAWPHANQFREILTKLWASYREPSLESMAEELTPDVDDFEAIEASYACNGGIVLALAAASEPDAAECMQYVWNTVDLMSDFRPTLGIEMIEVIERAIDLVNISKAEMVIEIKLLSDQNQL